MTTVVILHIETKTTSNPNPPVALLPNKPKSDVGGPGIPPPRATDAAFLNDICKPFLVIKFEMFSKRFMIASMITKAINSCREETGDVLQNRSHQNMELVKPLLSQDCDYRDAMWGGVGDLILLGMSIFLLHKHR